MRETLLIANSASASVLGSGGKAQSITLRNVPAFAERLGVPLEVEINSSRSAYFWSAGSNGGRPIQMRQGVNDTRGYISELLAKAIFSVRARGGIVVVITHRRSMLAGVDTLLALPIAVATPLYQIAKLLGTQNSRSAPSWGQMGQGLLGVGEGLLQRMK